jgi:hypothetical protein
MSFGMWDGGNDLRNVDQAHCHMWAGQLYSGQNRFRRRPVVLRAGKNDAEGPNRKDWANAGHDATKRNGMNLDGQATVGCSAYGAMDRAETGVTYEAYDKKGHGNYRRLQLCFSIMIPRIRWTHNHQGERGMLAKVPLLHREQ